MENEELKAQIIHSYVYSSSHARFHRERQERNSRYTEMPATLLKLCGQIKSKRATNRRSAIVEIVIEKLIQKRPSVAPQSCERQSRLQAKTDVQQSIVARPSAAQAEF
ncbi:hypothetical protein FQA47_013107 [Oryzias melastigma]|uniref:Uncharacterized protein n=1 Tax=Oryzias melastigma TaxID=30732 RepID=A0A834CBU2_ORYME|nr:hypothetical protein FQA47_013107 [Oryzias melastigma]